MGYESAKTMDSMPAMRRITRSTVDENTVFFSGLTDKTRANAIVALSGNINESSQMDECAVEKVQRVINDEDDQETDGQLPVSSKQQVGKPLFVSSEFDDTAELNFDANDFTTTNQSIGDEVFTQHSSSISHNDVITQDWASYPETINGCIQVINELRHAVKALHLTINENEHLLGRLQADALSTQQEIDQLHGEWGNWETEYHRRNHEARSGRGHRGENRTWVQTSKEVGRSDLRRSMSGGFATPNVDCRQIDRRPADQRRGTSRPSYNMDQVFHGVRRDGQERQSRDGEEGHPKSFSRSAPPKRGMQPSFFRGGWGAISEGNNKKCRGQTTRSWQNLKQKWGEGCFNCNKLGNCTRGTCLTTNVTCAICTKMGHLPSKCWRNLDGRCPSDMR